MNGNVIQFREKPIDIEEMEAKPVELCRYRLRHYDTESAVDSLPRQLSLLQVLGAWDDKLRLSYVLRTEPNNAGVMVPIFDVVASICGDENTVGTAKANLESLLGITFRHTYNVRDINDIKGANDANAAQDIKGANADKGDKDTKDANTQGTKVTSAANASKDTTAQDLKYRRDINTRLENVFPTGNSCYITPVSRLYGGNQFVGMAAWSSIIDLLRSQTGLMKLELTAIPRGERPVNNGKPVAIRRHRTDSVLEGSREAAHYFNSLLEHGGYEKLTFDYIVKISSDRKIHSIVPEYIGNLLSGDGQFEMLDGESASESDVRQLNPMSAVHLLKLFHTPFGAMTKTVGEGTLVTNIMLKDIPEASGKRESISLGKVSYKTMQGEAETEIRISAKDRLRHFYIIGGTGTGKTNLLKNMAEQDIRYSEGGVTIIDPHGDLADHSLACVPENRVDDVVFLDFSETEYLPVLNPFDIDKTDAVAVDRAMQEVLYLIKQGMDASWCGPRFDTMAKMAFLTFFDEGYPFSASLADVAKLFIDESFQNLVVPKLKNQSLKKQWIMEQGRKRSSDFEEVTIWAESKFSRFSNDHILRLVVGGGKSSVDVEKIINEGKILIVKIPKAVVGEYTADFIWSLLVLRLKNAMMRRKYNSSDDAGKNHYIYIDEFQHFVGNFGSMQALLAEARKFGFGLVLANQNTAQLRQYDTYSGRVSNQMLEAILGNAGNVVAFKLGVSDAESMAPRFNVPPHMLMNIGRYEAVARILTDGFDTSAFSLRPDEAKIKRQSGVPAVIKARSKGTVLVDSEMTLKEINRRNLLQSAG